jgi:hypothetical protein
MHLINETLDNGNWSHDFRERLQAVEIACWYAGPEGEQEAEPSPKKRKHKGSSSQVKRSRHSSKQSNADQMQKDVEEFVKNNPTSSGSTSSTSGQTVAQSSMDQEWKESVNKTLEALTQMLQASQASQKSDPPPIPPRPKLSGSSSDDQTILKQRPLPTAPIPRRLSTAVSSGGARALQLSTTYQDFESVDNSGEEYSDQDDDRPDTSEADLGRVEKRRMHLGSIPLVVPDLNIPLPPEHSKRLVLLQEKSKTNVMPFLTEMYDQIAKGSVVRDRRQRDPFSRLPGFYPTVEPAESGILKNRDVPRELLNHVPEGKLMTSGSSGRIAKLNPENAEGAVEHAALQSFKQATGYIRLANNLEIDVEMLQTLVSTISKITEDIDQVKGLPKEAKSKLLTVGQKVRLLNKTIFDVQSTNADLVKSSMFQYQKALVDRRNAWVNSATMLKGTAAELKRADFPRPSHQDLPKKLEMFGEEGMSIVRENDQIQQQASLHYRNYQGPTHTWVPSMGGPNRYRSDFRGGYGFRNQGHGQRRGFGHGGQPQNVRGHNNRRRPQGERRPSNRGNRGNRQPFSQTPASYKKQ